MTPSLVPATIHIIVRFHHAHHAHSTLGSTGVILHDTPETYSVSKLVLKVGIHCPPIFNLPGGITRIFISRAIRGSLALPMQQQWG